MGIAAHTFRQPFSSTTEVQPHLLNLINYKLTKIRNLYQYLRSVALPGSPFVTTPQFKRLVYQLDVHHPDEVISAFLPPGRPDSANYYHFITSLTLYSATHWYYKVKFLFSLFDFDSSDGISFDELVIMGSAVLTASCIMTGERPNNREEVNSVMQRVFEELQGDTEQISLERLFKWVMREPETMRLLSKNEPIIRYREDERVFEGLHVRGSAAERQSMGELSQRKVRKGLTSDQNRLLRELFNEMDLLGSGKVREKDFLSELISRRMSSTVLKKFLPFSTEQRSLPELLDLLRPFAKHLRNQAFKSQKSIVRKLLPQQKVEEYRRLFQLLDSNFNGSLDAEELRRGLEYHSSAEIGKLMHQYDFDESKELQFYEFLRMVAPEEYAIPQNIVEEYQATSPKYQATSPKQAMK